MNELTMGRAILFAISLLLVAGLYAWFLHALRRAVARREHWDTYLWAFGILVAALLFWIPSAVAETSDWSVMVTIGVLLGYFLWFVISRIFGNARVASEAVAPDGKAGPTNPGVSSRPGGKPMEAILDLGTHAGGERHVFHIELAQPGDWPSEWTPPSPHFALLLAWDSEGAGQVIDHAFAESLTHLGLALFACWGPGSEGVHDLFDEVVGRAEAPDEGGVVLTTWHPDGSFEEAVEFFLITALPAENYISTCRTWVVATLGDSSLKARILEVLARDRGD